MMSLDSWLLEETSIAKPVLILTITTAGKKVSTANGFNFNVFKFPPNFYHNRDFGRIAVFNFIMFYDAVVFVFP